MPRTCIRSLRLTVSVLFLLSLQGTAFSRGRVPVRAVTVTTLNIKYFGLNGDPNSTVPESRSATIKAHLTREQLFTDVMVFEEIVDVEMLKTEIVGAGYRCHSYDHPNPTHQHVVICAKAAFTLEQAHDDDNFILEDVTLGEDRYRPAVHGVLKDGRGRPLLHIFGVHLKAYPQFSNIRLQQADVVAEYMDQRVEAAPIMILGDFNTYTDDVAHLTARFGQVEDGLAQVNVPGQFTWRSGSSGSKLDHIWLSRSAVASRTRIAGPCNSTDRAAIDLYNQQVSDHCPVTMTVTPAQSTR